MKISLCLSFRIVKDHSFLDFCSRIIKNNNMFLFFPVFPLAVCRVWALSSVTMFTCEPWTCRTTDWTTCPLLCRGLCGTYERPGTNYVLWRKTTPPTTGTWKCWTCPTMSWKEWSSSTTHSPISKLSTWVTTGSGRCRRICRTTWRASTCRTTIWCRSWPDRWTGCPGWLTSTCTPIASCGCPMGFSTGCSVWRWWPSGKTPGLVKKRRTSQGCWNGPRRRKQPSSAVRVTRDPFVAKRIRRRRELAGTLRYSQSRRCGWTAEGWATVVINRLRGLQRSRPVYMPSLSFLRQEFIRKKEKGTHPWNLSGPPQILTVSPHTQAQQHVHCLQPRSLKTLTARTKVQASVMSSIKGSHFLSSYWQLHWTLSEVSRLGAKVTTASSFDLKGKCLWLLTSSATIITFYQQLFTMSWKPAPEKKNVSKFFTENSWANIDAYSQCKAAKPWQTFALNAMLMLSLSMPDF